MSPSSVLAATTEFCFLKAVKLTLMERWTNSKVAPKHELLHMKGCIILEMVKTQIGSQDLDLLFLAVPQFSWVTSDLPFHFPVVYFLHLYKAVQITVLASSVKYSKIAKKTVAEDTALG